MKVLHLAAFTGNSGDCLCHSAFQEQFRELVCTNTQFYEVNLRDFYKNSRIREFDIAFAQEINCYDAFILGGDLMFDVRWNYSATGTTLDFTCDFIDAIRIPVILNGIGYAEPPVFSDIEEQMTIFAKFKSFIEYLSAKNNWLLNLRNDGSYERIQNRFSDNLATHFSVVPDNGFYFNEQNVLPYKFENEKRTVGICISNDSFTHVDVYENRRITLNKSIADFIYKLIDDDCRIILFPHMPKDIEAIYKLYLLLGERAFRYNIVVAPYNNLDKLSIATLLSYYKACHCVVGMRYHSSVIPIVCRIPCIGLAAESLIVPERIIALYKKLDLTEFCMEVPMEMDNVWERLYQQYIFTMDNIDNYKRKVNRAMFNINKERIEYFSRIKSFIEHFNYQ